MDKRYSHQEMNKLWTPETKFRIWVQVEKAVLLAKIRKGYIDGIGEDEVDEACGQIVIDTEEINQIEREKTKHDVKAFLEHTSPQLPEKMRPHWHGGMTSYDAQDTAFHYLLRESCLFIAKELGKFLLNLKDKAEEYKYTPQIGRTHGVHAEPITFGVKLIKWYADGMRHYKRITRMSEEVAVGKISGAVGMYTLPPEIETEALRLLALRPVVSTQIISRDILAEYIFVLESLQSYIANLALNIRLLAQTEIREVQEYFSKDQTGSSAMPHKRNPISSENLGGQDRSLSFTGVAISNQQTWHERSLDNSSFERNTVPMVSNLCAYSVARMNRIMKKLLVYPERMKKNLALTNGLIHSQTVQKLVAEKSGLPREEAHELVRRVAQECQDQDADFLGMLLNCTEIASRVSREDLETCFDLQAKLKFVDYIFEQCLEE